MHSNRNLIEDVLFRQALSLACDARRRNRISRAGGGPYFAAVIAPQTF